MISRLLTKNFRKIPLVYVLFDLNKYRKNGAKNSCTLSLHPLLRNDEYIVTTMEALVEYIRDRYNMEEIA